MGCEMQQTRWAEDPIVGVSWKSDCPCPWNLHQDLNFLGSENRPVRALGAGEKCKARPPRPFPPCHWTKTTTLPRTAIYERTVMATARAKDLEAEALVSPRAADTDLQRF
jgi:hypothetical protein